MAERWQHFFTSAGAITTTNAAVTAAEQGAIPLLTADRAHAIGKCVVGLVFWAIILYTSLRDRHVSFSPISSSPPKPTVLVATVFHYISWAAFLYSVSEEGAKTFFSTLSVQESLSVLFNRPAEKCFLDERKVSVQEWKEYIVEGFDSAYVNEIPGAKEWLARTRGGEGEGEGGA